VLSSNAQEKRSKRARLSVEARAAKNAEAAQRMQVHRRQLTEEARVDANAQAAHRYSQTRIIEIFGRIPWRCNYPGFTVFTFLKPPKCLGISSGDKGIKCLR
jgi:hypothetical protein